jgi:hypothetical protein
VLVFKIFIGNHDCGWSQDSPCFDCCFEVLCYRGFLVELDFDQSVDFNSLWFQILLNGSIHVALSLNSDYKLFVNVIWGELHFVKTHIDLRNHVF